MTIEKLERYELTRVLVGNKRLEYLESWIRGSATRRRLEIPNLKWCGLLSKRLWALKWGSTTHSFLDHRMDWQANP